MRQRMLENRPFLDIISHIQAYSYSIGERASHSQKDRGRNKRYCLTAERTYPQLVLAQSRCFSHALHSLPTLKRDLELEALPSEASSSTFMHELHPKSHSPSIVRADTTESEITPRTICTRSAAQSLPFSRQACSFAIRMPSFHPSLEQSSLTRRNGWIPNCRDIVLMVLQYKEYMCAAFKRYGILPIVGHENRPILF